MGMGRKSIALKMKRRTAQAKKKARIKKKIAAAKKQLIMRTNCLTMFVGQLVQAVVYY